MLRIAIAASGNGTNFEQLVQASLNNTMPLTKICCLIVDNKNAYAIERAKKYEIPTFVFSTKQFATKQDYEKAILKILQNNNIELLALAGYMRIVGDVLLQAFHQKIINIHPSYLPHFAGKNGIADAFASGQLESGVSIHFVNQTIDGGQIILQEKTSFKKGQCLAEWEQQIHQLEFKIYHKAITKINPYL